MVSRKWRLTLAIIAISYGLACEHLTVMPEFETFIRPSINETNQGWQLYWPDTLLT